MGTYGMEYFDTELDNGIVIAFEYDKFYGGEKLIDESFNHEYGTEVIKYREEFFELEINLESVFTCLYDSKEERMKAGFTPLEYVVACLDELEVLQELEYES